MTLQAMLDAMKSPKTSFFILSVASVETYKFQLEFSRNYNGEGFKLESAPHPHLHDAIEEVYHKWLLITGVTFTDAIPPALTYHEPDITSYNIDDEVPL